MSAHIVDDLHAAEDRAAELEAVLTRVLGRIDAQHAVNRIIGVHRVTGFDDAVSEAQRILADRYCRSSCHGTFVRPPNFTDERGMVWEGEACDPDCGCPCGHET